MRILIKSLCCLWAAFAMNTNIFGQNTDRDVANLKKIVAAQEAKIKVLTSGAFAVGSIQQSLLTEAQFQAAMGSTDWVLMDGRTVTGSAYATLTGKSKIPAAQGRFLRMAGGNAGPIGEPQTQGTAPNKLSLSGGAHKHRVEWDIAYRGNILPGGSEILVLYRYNTQTGLETISGGAHGHTISGDPETRPINIAVNYFIKIN
ncbi:MAG: hypothetical protein HRU19_12610 [Pseudobacteriovorax sp.]|nr:hypothetical protein [Pseudobacteriovorax sp.]